MLRPLVDGVHAGYDLDLGNLEATSKHLIFLLCNLNSELAVFEYGRVALSCFELTLLF